MSELFHKYYFDKEIFKQKSKKSRILVWIGILVQLSIVTAGVMLLPQSRLPIWIVIATLSTIVMMAVLVVLCFKQLKYSSYKRWLKNYEKIK